MSSVVTFEIVPDTATEIGYVVGHVKRCSDGDHGDEEEEDGVCDSQRAAR